MEGVCCQGQDGGTWQGSSLAQHAQRSSGPPLESESGRTVSHTSACSTWVEKGGRCAESSRLKPGAGRLRWCKPAPRGLRIICFPDGLCCNCSGAKPRSDMGAANGVGTRAISHVAQAFPRVYAKIMQAGIDEEIRSDLERATASTMECFKALVIMPEGEVERASLAAAKELTAEQRTDAARVCGILLKALENADEGAGDAN